MVSALPELKIGSKYSTICGTEMYFPKSTKYIYYIRNAHKFLRFVYKSLRHCVQYVSYIYKLVYRVENIFTYTAIANVYEKRAYY